MKRQHQIVIPDTTEQRRAHRDFQDAQATLHAHVVSAHGDTPALRDVIDTCSTCRGIMDVRNIFAGLGQARFGYA